MNKAEWLGTLFARALEKADSVEEAAHATVLAVQQRPEPPVDAYFAHDIFNPHAQRILNLAVKAMRRLNAAARKELGAILKLEDRNAFAHAVVAFVDRFRVQLARLLTTTQLAALLQGAQEVAANVPAIPPPGMDVPPPSLGPVDAVALVERLSGLERSERELAIYELPAHEQRYVRQALSVHQAGPPPRFPMPGPPEGEPGIHWPIIEEAARSLADKRLVTREVFDQLDAAARQKAFTVAGVSARETLEKIRDALVKSATEGPDVKAFREAILEAVDEGTFLSDAHMETVYRTNIQTAFSDGQMTVLQQPFVRSGFPYTTYDAIHDDRVRHNHLALEKLGIDGTNIYRINDPVFQTFRPPWDWCDRCGWIPLTVKHAAELGCKEAQRWLETGQEPTPPAFVPMPSFRPPPEFQRSIGAMPLSIRLSMEPVIVPEEGTPKRRRKKRRMNLRLPKNWSACFGMIGDEWHGPKPPGEGWVKIAPGPRGGMRWKRGAGGQQPAQHPQQAQPVQPQAPTLEQKAQAKQKREERRATPVDEGPKPNPIAAQVVGVGMEQGHPLANAKTPEEVMRAIGADPSKPLAYLDNPNPLHYDLAKFPPNVNAETFVPAVTGAVRGQEAANPFQRMTIKELYDKVSQQQPMSYFQFQSALAKMQKDGEIRLGPFTQALATHPDPKMLMPLDREMKWYVEPGKRSTQQQPPVLPPKEPAQEIAKPVIKPTQPNPIAQEGMGTAHPSYISSSSLAGNLKDFKLASTPQEANERAHKLGVDAELGDDVDAANYVLAGLTALKNMGLPLPGAASIVTFTKENNAIGSHGEGGTSFNSRVLIKHVRDLTEAHAMEQRGEKVPGWVNLSTTDPLHFVIHEAGHNAHIRRGGYADGEAKDALLKQSDVSEVSRYAKQDYKEFVAEVFAGMVAGKKYSPQTLDLYRKMGGYIDWRWESQFPRQPKPEATPKPAEQPTPQPAQQPKKPWWKFWGSLEPQSLGADLEYFGSESPGDGWEDKGSGRWVKKAREIKIAVVGGGPGGMFATYILNQRLPDAKVTLFESSDRLGGKIKTDRFADGTPYESGVAELYEYLGPSEDPLRQLIEDDLGLKTANMRGGAVVIGEDIYHSMDDLPEKTRERVERFHEHMVELMPLQKYATRWQPDNSHPWANRTFHECLEDEIRDDPLAVAYIKAAVHSDLATEPHTCNGLNAIKNILMDNDEYMQLYHVVGGIEQVAEALAEKLKADVRLESHVVAIDKADAKYRLTVRDGNEHKEEDFDCVIVAMPNHWLSHIQWKPKTLKERIHRVCAHYDLPAHYFRVSMNFKEPWWEEYGMPGDYWMMDIFNGCCVYDESARWMTGPGNVLSFLIAGQDALLMCSNNQTKKEIAQYVLDNLPEFMKEAEAELLEVRIARFAGSINAQPGSWPVRELRGEHVPDRHGSPGVFLCCDAFFDSTLNAALISANTAVDCLLEHLGLESAETTEAIDELKSKELSL